MMKLIRPHWSAPPTVDAICTTRVGGDSGAPYDSFNLSPYVGDEQTAVKNNRIKLGKLLPSAPRWLQQAHTTKVMRAEEVIPDNTVADATYTTAVNVVCAVMCADCMPISFCSADGKKVAAAHAGWRGLAAGVLENTVACLRADGDAGLMAWLGPSIGVAHYEVGEEVRTALCREVADEVCFTPTGKGKWLADLPSLARRRLGDLNIACTGYDGCTFAERQYFYSARRDTTTGRMAALIWRTDE